MTPTRRPSLLRALALAATLGLAGCGDEPAARPDDRLLVVDGITVTLDDVAPYVTFLDSFLPEGGRKAKVRRVVEEYVLPLRLAQRAFPEQRAALLRQAEALCEVATNVDELERLSAQMSDRSRHNATRLQPKLPVAMFLFDPMLERSVSPPLELPTGWVVTAAFELHQSALLIDDYVDALQVGFMTHDAETWGTWIAAERARIGDAVTWVHPDYREAMPPWLRLPRLP